MIPREPFWKLSHLSSDALEESLRRAVASSRKATAEIVAHLGEIEERRLHLEHAFGSLFDYCVRSLGLSEDDACRRIDVARQARRFPALFPPLASGEISLSVAALLKPVLTEDNAGELLALVANKSVSQAREALAARFPKPDVASRVRKLPDTVQARGAPGAASQPSLESVVTQTEPGASERAATPSGPIAPSVRDGADSETRPAQAPATSSTVSNAPRRQQRVEPLAAARYRIEFTAGKELRDKLELARDLMRQRNPSGDFAPIIERALDLLLEDIQKQRFGMTRNLGLRSRASAVASATKRAGESLSAMGSSARSPTPKGGAVPIGLGSSSSTPSHAARAEARGQRTSGCSVAPTITTPPSECTGATTSRRASKKAGGTRATSPTASAIALGRRGSGALDRSAPSQGRRHLTHARERAPRAPAHAPTATFIRSATSRTPRTRPRPPTRSRSRPAPCTLAPANAPARSARVEIARARRHGRAPPTVAHRAARALRTRAAARRHQDVTNHEGRLSGKGNVTGQKRYRFARTPMRASGRRHSSPGATSTDAHRGLPRKNEHRIKLERRARAG